VERRIDCNGRSCDANFYLLRTIYARCLHSAPIIAMGVAAFMIHGGDPLGKKELALLYFSAYFAIATLGPGKYSLDSKYRRVS
jgi:uncharacterized membrane protein YphA (DoxX/SURF4 family)